MASGEKTVPRMKTTKNRDWKCVVSLTRSIKIGQRQSTCVVPTPRFPPALCFPPEFARCASRFLGPARKVRSNLRAVSSSESFRVPANMTTFAPWKNVHKQKYQILTRYIFRKWGKTLHRQTVFNAILSQTGYTFPSAISNRVRERGSMPAFLKLNIYDFARCEAISFQYY